MRNPRSFSGAGAPTTAPVFVGDEYQDTSTGALYKAMLLGGAMQWVQLLPLEPGSSQSMSGIGSPSFVTSLIFTIPAGGGGAPDDVQLFNANFPVPAEIIGASMLVTGAVALSTVQLRDAAGGGGNARSGPIDTATTGRNNEGNGGGFTSGVVAAASSLFLRRADSAIAGQLVILCRFN